MAANARWAESQVREVEGNFIDEVSSAWMYRSLASLDRDDERASLLRELAEYEEKHAAIWKSLLETLGVAIPSKGKMGSHRVMKALATLFGVNSVLPLLHKSEVDGIEKYRRQAMEFPGEEVQRAFSEILPDEVAHEVDLFETMRKGGEASRGGLRSAILGANDGLGSILALAAGVVGATNSSFTVVIAGVAGLVAGAVSMAASNYISIKSEQEVYASQVQLQRQALQVARPAKLEQLRETYQRKGFTEEEAKGIVKMLASSDEELLRVLVAEKHGLGEVSFQRPGKLALYTGLAFAAAGAIPVVPFVVAPPLEGLATSVALTGAALFLAGVFRSLMTLRPFLRSGVEMLAIGMGSAAATYVLGVMIGATGI